MLNSSRPRVAILASSRAPGLDHLLNDPARGTRYELAACITTEEELAGREAIEAAGVPVIPHPIRRFYRERGLALRNLNARRFYDEATADLLERLDVDLVFLTSYLYILTEPMLRRYSGRILNIHDSDLTIKDEEGQRKYVGLHSTRAAILAGERETRATVHLVTENVDQGPLVLVSDRFPVASLVSDALRWGAFDMVKAYAYAQREWMIRAAWGPLLRRTLELITSENLHFVRDIAWVDGMPGPCLFEGVLACQDHDGPPATCPFLRPAHVEHHL